MRLIIPFKNFRELILLSSFQARWKSWNFLRLSSGNSWKFSRRVRTRWLCHQLWWLWWYSSVRWKARRRRCLWGSTWNLQNVWRHGIFTRRWNSLFWYIYIRIFSIRFCCVYPIMLKRAQMRPCYIFAKNAFLHITRRRTYAINGQISQGSQ